jgi:RND family efflux transporter MFP subunit
MWEGLYAPIYLPPNLRSRSSPDMSQPIRSFPLAPALPLALALTLLAACHRDQPAAPSATALPSVRVSVATVERVIAPIVVETAGTVRPVERAVIAAKISGTVAALPLTLGQTVKRGDLLVRLAAPEFAARAAQARAALDQAERDEQRTRTLAASGADTHDAAAAAADRLRAARAALTEAEAMLGYTEIHAPYDGRVAAKHAYPGDLASPGQPLLVLESSAAFQVEAAMPASLTTTLTLGTSLTVHVADTAAPLLCPVAEIAAAADPATRTVLVKLALPATDAALSGRAARVELPGAPTEALLAPVTTVTRFGQMERVFVVADGHVQLRLVKTGAVRGDRVELLSGVSAGDTLVVAPALTLRDGQPVTSAP